MPVQRHVFGPDVDFFDSSVYDLFGFSDVVQAGDTLYVSGIVPLRGAPPELEVIGEGDFRAQYTFVLDMLKTLLERAGATFPDSVVNVNVLTTDMNDVNANCDVFANAFAGHHPAATYMGVAQLFHPAQLVEINATAYIGDERRL